MEEQITWGPSPAEQGFTFSPLLSCLCPVTSIPARLMLLGCFNSNKALAGVAQWIEWWPATQKVADSIPSQGTYLACGPSPQVVVCKRQLIDLSLAHWCFSPSLSPSLPFSLKINKNF